MYLGTFFLRNRPALELMRLLISGTRSGATVRIAVLGCSIGVEVYSILSVLRPTRPDLEIVVTAVDISDEALAIGREGVYGPETSRLVGSEIFERLSTSEIDEIFDRRAEQFQVKPWLRRSISWQLDDVSAAGINDRLGLHDFVVASNFLCHMDPRAATSCLRNLATLVTDGGYLFVTGVDLDVKTEVARDQGWEPVTELLDEIHDGDPSVRADWPWRWWGLEPIDRSRADWRARYACALRIANNRGEAANTASAG
jgi:chemotaxis methyl-accepting protein methylase